MNKFSKGSLDKLDQAHKDLKLILLLALKRSDVDFGIIQTSRTIEQQQEYYDNGKSSINPSKYASPEDLAKKANHIVIPGHPIYGKSRAADIKIAEKCGKWLTFDVTHLSHVAGIIQCCAKELFEKGLVDHIIRWGGDWNRNGVIALDQKLDDYPHVELLKKER